jgi:hypothetical protein
MAEEDGNLDFSAIPGRSHESLAMTGLRVISLVL